MKEPLNIVIVGVGGQGSLLASRLLGHIAQSMGQDVKISEVHGMSQRGGSVITHVRMGERVFSPLVEQGGADFLLAFEELEALRALPYLKENGCIILNTQKIMPLPVIVGAAKYPENIVKILESHTQHVVATNALALAEQSKNPRAVNIVLLGILAARLGFGRDIWLAALAATVPPKQLSTNIAAFNAGFLL